jgi:hypothetical protein
MGVFFSADDRQEYLDPLSESASKHALDFLARCLMSHHAHFRGRASAGESARAHVRRSASQFSVKVGGGLCGDERVHSYPTDDRPFLAAVR